MVWACSAASVYLQTGPNLKEVRTELPQHRCEWTIKSDRKWLPLIVAAESHATGKSFYLVLEICEKSLDISMWIFALAEGSSSIYLGISHFISAFEHKHRQNTRKFIVPLEFTAPSSLWLFINVKTPILFSSNFSLICLNLENKRPHRSSWLI